MTSSLYINGKWQDGSGAAFESIDPSNGDIVWTGRAAGPSNVDAAFEAARAAFESWSRTSLAERISIVNKFKVLAEEFKPKMAELISKETGKLLWDSTGEAGVLVSKVDVSLKSYEERTGQLDQKTAFGQASLRHKPHGVFAVLGPYNFPAHLPNGQIIPALIAGNTVVFKPSEQCPAVGAALTDLYARAGFPSGVINLVQGARDTGATVLGHPELDGVLFTGSARTGAYIHKVFGGRPEIVLALEMGGNNPLIIWNAQDAEAAASIAVQSAFITSGQRCTCARRLIIPQGTDGERIVDALVALTDRLTVGAWHDSNPASVGPLVSGEIAKSVVTHAASLTDKGASVIRESKISERGEAFIEPGIYDVTGMDVPDEEIFGPVLQIIRVRSWVDAIKTANDTKYGLAAGLVSDDAALWDEFRARIRAGVVNFNRPTTGAAGFLPFGGPGASGNHNPGAYYAADFCAWPMASQISDTPEFLPMQGMKNV